MKIELVILFIYNKKEDIFHSYLEFFTTHYDVVYSLSSLIGNLYLPIIFLAKGIHTSNLGIVNHIVKYIM